MLETLIRSKTRIRLILRLFLNPKSSVYLRGLASEFNESTNSVRVELKRFEQAGLIESTTKGNRKIYKANTEFPLFSELQNIAFKHLGIDQIVDQVLTKIGNLQSVYLTGDMALGLDTSIIDLVLIGTDINVEYAAKLVKRAEKHLKKKIRTVIYNENEKLTFDQPMLLIFGEA